MGRKLCSARQRLDDISRITTYERAGVGVHFGSFHPTVDSGMGYHGAEWLQNRVERCRNIYGSYECGLERGQEDNGERERWIRVGRCCEWSYDSQVEVRYTLIPVDLERRADRRNRLGS